MKKVYSIWIVPLAPTYMDGIVRSYSLKENIVSNTKNIKNSKDVYDKIQIVDIYTSKSHDIRSKYEVLDELLSPISLLLTNIVSDRNEKKEIANKRYGMRIQYEDEDDHMCNLGEALFFEGVEQGMIELLVNLVKDGEISIVQASKRLNVSVEEFEKLMK